MTSKKEESGFCLRMVSRTEELTWCACAPARDREPPKILRITTCGRMALGSTRRSNGRHGDEGELISATSEGFEGGTQVLWNRAVTSHGGGASAACVVAFILEGEAVALGDGTALSFDGTEVKQVAGGGLSKEEDPTA